MLSALIGVALMITSNLPVGTAPPPVRLPHFPDALHAFVWRNWPLVSTERLAKTVDASPEEIMQIGEAMGLPAPPVITPDSQRRSHLTVIRRNWHLLPYDQLLTLLGWNEKQLAFTLQEDDFFYIKLGSLKPHCKPIKYHPSDAATQAREAEIASEVKQFFHNKQAVPQEPLFGFVSSLSKPVPVKPHSKIVDFDDKPLRMCYSYFALYGDPLLDKEADPYPEGLLSRLAASGVNGVWLQALLYKLVPFPWDSKLSNRHAERIEGLKTLVARARKHGIGIYLYLNEPRSMPLSFFTNHPELKGMTEGDYATLCTSTAEVQRYISEGIANICREVPDLGGFFTITRSENLTNCWSHGGGSQCPRCGKRGLPAVVAEVNTLVQNGIDSAKSRSRLIAWDWGWPNEMSQDIIDLLPIKSALMSVSEWDIPIKRGGVDSVVGEYSLSTIGPGRRALSHWAMARKRGLRTVAKIQAGNTWELSSVPYIPAVANAAQHAANLRDAHVDDIMLGWTLGGYPSPNLEVVTAISNDNTGAITPDVAMKRIASERYGAQNSKSVVNLWKACSKAFQEFPFHIGMVYTAPLQVGPANLLWAEPTHYSASMTGFPYDDLDSWRAVYPSEVFISQFAKMGEEFLKAVVEFGIFPHSGDSDNKTKFGAQEHDLAMVAAVTYRSIAHQARFIVARNKLTSAKSAEEAAAPLRELSIALKNEIILARMLYDIQIRDSRVGFEASNQYFFVPIDLVEKVINCNYLLNHWLPEQKRKWNVSVKIPN